MTRDIVISFDTTGSMSQCIKEVRKNVTELVKRLFVDVPDLRVGLVCHGDYCDEGDTYLMKHVDLTTDVNSLVKFIKETGDTGGGDYPEAYEYVLREVQKFSWEADSLRALVVIGDATPHEKDKNPGKIDWREEVEEINRMGISIFSIQALNRGHGPSYTFYKHMADKTNGYHLFLDQFSYIRDMILAICHRMQSEENAARYEQEMIERNNGMTHSMKKFFDILLKRKHTDAVFRDDDDAPAAEEVGELIPCPPAKYQILEVENDITIKDYVTGRGLRFKPGMGFYEFTKPENISPKKLVVLMKKTTGELFEGRRARVISGFHEDKRYKPSDLPDYKVYVQSTSFTRKLVGGTGFLYLDAEFGRVD